MTFCSSYSSRCCRWLIIWLSIILSLDLIRSVWGLVRILKLNIFCMSLWLIPRGKWIIIRRLKRKLWSFFISLESSIKKRKKLWPIIQIAKAQTQLCFWIVLNIWATKESHGTANRKVWTRTVPAKIFYFHKKYRIQRKKVCKFYQN